MFISDIENESRALFFVWPWIWLVVKDLLRHVIELIFCLCFFLQLEPLVPGEWDALYGLQSPISSGFSDDFGNLQWVIPDEFFGEETGHSLPPDVNSSQTAVT